MSGDSPELSKYHSHEAEIVTRARYLTKKSTKTTAHERFQYTMMLLVICTAQFVHHMLVLSPELSRYHARDTEIVIRSDKIVVFHQEMQENNRWSPLPVHHDAARNACSKIRASCVGAVSRILKMMLLAEWEISSSTQVKN